jgi:hypothetical protein
MAGILWEGKQCGSPLLLSLGLSGCSFSKYTVECSRLCCERKDSAIILATEKIVASTGELERTVIHFTQFMELTDDENFL